MEMKEITRQYLTGERALFAERDAVITETTFADGESPLKESKNIELYGSFFKWKYPLWYAKGIKAEGCVWYSGARAGVWYSSDVTVRNCAIEAPKNFRRCDGLTLENVSIPDAKETLWHCKNVRIDGAVVRGDYFAMNCRDMEVDNLTLHGNYSFDGVKNVTIRNSKLLTKDAFWNSDGVTVYDSFISGEYLGWNAKNLTLINCTVESLQGLCYIDNLVMKNCRLINTTLAFEYSSVDADIVGRVDSILNPSEGRIECDGIGILTVERDRVDPEKTVIKVRNGSDNE